MVPNLAGNSERSDLVRGLALWSATAMSSAIHRHGNFSCTSEMARAVGSATCFHGMDHRWTYSALGAFCHAELGAAFPKAGAPYVYLSRGLGPLWGFLFGWMSSLLERPVGMATLATGFVRFFGFLVSYRGHAFIHNPARRLGVHPSTRPNAGGFDGGGRYGYELLQCGDEWRDLGSTYVQKGHQAQVRMLSTRTALERLCCTRP